MVVDRVHSIIGTTSEAGDCLPSPSGRNRLKSAFLYRTVLKHHVKYFFQEF
jgi:hypothetical protein